MSRKFIVYIALAFASLSARGAVADLLAAFDSKPTVEHANAYFAALDKEGFTDSRVTFRADTPADTLKLQVWYWAAEYLNDAQRYADARRYGERALPLARAGGDKTLYGDCLNILAVVCVRLGDFAPAVGYAKACNDLDRATGDADKISSSLNTLAGIYMASRQPEEARKYILEAIAFSRRADNPARQAVLFGLASEVYRSLGLGDSALYFSEQALALEQRLGRNDKVAVRRAQMADALISLGRTDEAARQLLAAIPQLRADGNTHSLAIACNQMGDVCLGSGKDAEAAKYYAEALDIFLAQHDLYNESHSRKGLYNALRKSDPQAAMAHNDRYNQLRDSLYDRETGELLSQYAARYGNERLQDENESLRRSRWLWIGGLLGLLALLAFATWMRSRRRVHALRKALAIAQAATARPAATETEGGQGGAPHAATVSPQREVPSEAPAAVPTDADILQSVADAVADGMQSGQTDVASIAARLDITAATLRRRVWAAAHQTPKNYITALQMQHAAHLLTASPTLSMREVARACGFEEPSNFVRVFKRVYGVTPSRYIAAQVCPGEGRQE